jgi:hypothetical protein
LRKFGGREGAISVFFYDKGYSIWRAKQVLVSLFWANIPSFKEKRCCNAALQEKIMTMIMIN